jgi:TRAP-type uncharacterized transport system substrate-binding protein
MKKILLVALLSVFAQAAFAFTIATGPSDGTYFQIAQDINKLVAKDGVALQAQPIRISREQLLGSGKVN